MIQGGYCQGGIHPRVHRIAHDPVGVDIFDGAKVDLAQFVYTSEGGAIVRPEIVRLGAYSTILYS
ncbi:hypothetical protein MMIN_26440 [Mycolicibacter minnesotensis]|nr:hypothetical protein MMIN_26440 [Mycolicibacter minnesotensis]